MSLIVTKDNHPHLFEAFETISHDGGSRAGWNGYTVPEYWVIYVPIVDKVLGTLPKEEQETLCIGEHTEMQEIANRTPDLTRANAMFHAFFDEGWERA